MTEKLLPCPFCGGKPILDHLGGDAIWGWYIHCDDCEVQQIAIHQQPDAVAKWNRRSDLSDWARDLIKRAAGEDQKDRS